MTPTRPDRPRLSDEGGFTLAVAMGIMLIASIVCVAAFQAAGGDLVPSGENSDRKQAFASAESGIAWYQSRLASDPDYWQKCDTGTSGTPPTPDPVNQHNAAAASRKWRTVAGTGVNRTDFSLAVMPASPATACSTADPNSVISQTDGSFRIRSTGRYRQQQRSILTTFKRQRFLDFLYFTDYETLDPTVGSGNTACAAYRASRPTTCAAIQFAGGDRVNGPLHTNDDLVYCGAPTFGRSVSDNIHVSGPAPGYAPNANCGSGGTPNFQGTFRAAQRALQMPPTNASLKALTTPGFGGQGYLLTGTQYIRLNGDGTMVVDTPSGNPQNVALPPNGVLFVQDGGCTNTSGRDPQGTDYQEGPGCANVYVSGTANRSVTIASERDIIVAPTSATLSSNPNNQFNPATAGTASTDADLRVSGAVNTSTQQLSGTVQIGLIANNFVRVYHRVTSNSNGVTLSTGVRDVRIDAAILSLQHSFIVDNWAYGPSPGDLTVHGAIAQRFRGPVGTGSGSSISTGYSKNYWYDNRLRYRSPPYFLDPVNAAWTLSRSNELVPAV
jgi:Tfp pilus assembly protein PilX